MLFHITSHEFMTVHIGRATLDEIQPNRRQTWRLTQMEFSNHQIIDETKQATNHLASLQNSIHEMNQRWEQFQIRM